MNHIAIFESQNLMFRENQSMKTATKKAAPKKKAPAKKKK
jgi:hydroxyacyl-ACP dehydratase HTD2-like protein with hotdog domain